MISQADFKRFASLGQSKYRQKYGQFLVEGRKAVEEVFHSNLEIDTILATPAYSERNKLPFPIQTISQKDMERISQFSTPPGIIAIVRKMNHPIPTSIAKLALYLDGISDPGNLGAIMRIADWYGLDNLWLSGDCVDETNPKVIASSMGSFTRVTCYRSDEVFSLATHIWGADLNGLPIYQVTLDEQSKTLIVMGSESHGIRPNIANRLTQRIHIPKIGQAESLNV